MSPSGVMLLPISKLDIPAGTVCCYGYQCYVDVGVTYGDVCTEKIACTGASTGCMYRRLATACDSFGFADDACPNSGSGDAVCYVLITDNCVQP